MGEGSGKCSSFKLCFNLNDNQLKSSRYSYRSTYMNLKVTKNPQQIHTQKKKKQREKSTSTSPKKIIKPQGKKPKERKNRKE